MRKAIEILLVRYLIMALMYVAGIARTMHPRERKREIDRKRERMEGDPQFAYFTTHPYPQTRTNNNDKPCTALVRATKHAGSDRTDEKPIDETPQEVVQLGTDKSFDNVAVELGHVDGGDGARAKEQHL